MMKVVRIALVTLIVGISLASVFKVLGARNVSYDETTMAVGSKITLAERLGKKLIRWSSSNTVVLAIQNGFAVALRPGTSFLIAQYGSLRDSTLVTVVPAPLLAVTNLQSALYGLSYTTQGDSISWDAVNGATGYKTQTGTDTAGVQWNSVAVNRAYTVVPRIAGTNYMACVRATDSYGQEGPINCTVFRAADLDSLSIVMDSATMVVGSSSHVCAYGWYQQRVIRDWSIVLSSSDTTVAKVSTDPDPALCLSRISPNQLWPLP